MIDCHCHLEQPDYDEDRDEVIEKCKKELKAVITCCAHPKDFDLSLELVRKHKGFVFLTAAIHPEFIKEIGKDEKEKFFQKIRTNKNEIIGIGETGLDFSITEEELRNKQKELFSEFIYLANELDKPLIVHARKAFAEAIEILEKNNAKNVLMHFFSAKELMKKIIKNNWYISVNTALAKSKKIKKIVRDMPIEKILIETDSPWLGLNGRNDPTSVKIVIEKVAEIKKMTFEEVKNITTENAISFFKLKLLS